MPDTFGCNQQYIKLCRITAFDVGLQKVSSEGIR